MNKLSKIMKVIEGVEKLKQMKKAGASETAIYTQINSLRKDLERVENELSKEEWEQIRNKVFGLLEVL